MKQARYNKGYTLIEVIVVVIIIATLTSVAMRSLKGANEVAKIEQTKQTLTRLAHAISGNPDLRANGSRVDFGYVGDNGALPPNLNALVGNPGFSTWNGPYINDELSSGGGAVYFRQDAWGKDITFAGVTLSSPGGSIQKLIANSSNDLLLNSVTAAVTDLSHAPPGSVYRDSIYLVLSHPDGSGSIATRVEYPTANGLVTFGSVPVGLHTLQIIYLPTADTLTRKVCVEPGTNLYLELSLYESLW